MKTISLNLYTFDELPTEEAKEKARDWYRQNALDYEWYDGTYEEAKSLGLKITGFDLDRNRHATGEWITSAREAAESILKNHGEGCETFKEATAFLKERDEIVDTAEKDENGDFADEYALDCKLDDIENEFLKTLLEDYSIMLQNEYDYLLSDEAVEESIESNEYEFEEDVTRSRY